MKVIVVTGGIGSGKSSACRFLEREYGWPVYYADSKVKQLYAASPDLLDRIETALEGSFRDENGNFVSSRLASVIFSDASALEKVENIVFPALTSDFEAWKDRHTDCRYVILESATILEKPSLKGLGDITILIDAPIDVRARRASERDGVPMENILGRMQSQKLMNCVSQEGIDIGVDMVVNTDSTESVFHSRLRGIAEKLL